MASPRISIQNLSYTYPASDNPALSKVSMDVYPGEIHCLVGENGSGKSTLMHILSGFIPVKTDSIVFHDNILIRMVHQTPLISASLKVWEHIAVGHPQYFSKVFIGKTVCGNILNKLNDYPLFSVLAANINKPAGSLSPLQKHHLSLASAVLTDANILILDEPSIHLTPIEKETLFSLLLQLKAKGISIVLITHKLNELEQMGDRVTVLKKGKCAGSYSVKEFIASDAVNLLIPLLSKKEHKDSKTAPPREARQRDKSVSRSENKALLEVKGLDAKKGRESLHGINFTLRKGEVLGISGLRGEGLDLLEEVLAGIAVPSSGEISIGGGNYSRLTPQLLRKLHIGYIPTDRMFLGSTADASIEDNMILLEYRNLHSNGIFKRKEINKLTSRLYSSFNITGGNPGRPLTNLSGGNIQRVIVSREFSGSPDLVIFAEPYWGLDNNGKALIRDEIQKLSDEGTGIIILSPEIEDVTELCRRIIVLYEGSIVFDKEEASGKELSKGLLGIYEGNRP